jgi:poly-gamma-glutamate synthesis protein (capsule biosynthesis protein)
MGKRESFLLILIAAFFMLLLTIATFSAKNPRVKGFNFGNGEVEIILAGDIMLGRSVLTKSERVGNYRYPFLKVADELKQADIVFANLESPFVDNCPRTDSDMKFCSDPKMAEGLSFSGIDIVSLANNHSQNYGNEGLAETKRVLAEKNIKWVGESNLEISEKGGVKFGFLGFNFVSRQPTEADLKLIKDSDKKVDVLIVGVHWGGEYQRSANSFQLSAARRLVDAGADVIAGHHSHWVQPSENISGKSVYYSLGNFVFDQPWSEETKKGLLIKLTFKNGKLVKEEKLPVYMTSLGQPEFR